MRFSYANISALDSEKFMGISIGSRRGTQKVSQMRFFILMFLRPSARNLWYLQIHFS